MPYRTAHTVVANPDFNYDRKLALLDRDGLIAKIQNQRVEINNLLDCEKRASDMYCELMQTHNRICKFLKAGHYASAHALVSHRVTDGTEILREQANGKE